MAIHELVVIGASAGGLRAIEAILQGLPHTMVNRDRMRLSTGPRENGFRPAIDPLFCTAARAYGSSVMGVIPSGALADGTYGLKSIKDAGGLAVVQHPHEAEVPSMPRSALRGESQ